MDLNTLWINLQAIMPLAVLMLAACALLVMEAFLPAERKGVIAVLAVISLLVTLGLTLMQTGNTTAFNGMVMADGYARFLQVLFLGSGVLGILMAYDYLKRMGIERGEYYLLMIFSIGGMMMMAMASDLIMVFLALEWLSIPLYVLSGFAHPRADSEESAMKYFLLGAYSGGFVVYGISLVFGATGSTNLATIVSAINASTANLPMLTVGAALILIGLGFKVSVVPFHMWTPDVYQGAPSSVTGFMSVTAKAAGFAALLRAFTLAFPALADDLTPILWSLAALTMFLGNFVAIAQKNIKRMLAYSSIAHAGYILMALVPYGQSSVAQNSVASGLFYLLAYALTNLGAWGVVIALEKKEAQGLNLEDYAGLGQKYPALAFCMAIFMLSFTGIPPTLGFVGKLYLFRTAIEGGLIGLSLIGVLTSLVSAYYYLRVVVLMYFRPGEPEARRDLWLNLAIAVSAASVVLLSLAAAPVFQWAAEAVATLK